MKQLLCIVIGLGIIVFCSTTLLKAEEKWQGVDEAVVQKIAREHGHEASKSLIDTSEGDVQLFAFLIAGVVGGFGAGYYWRVLLEGKKKPGDGD
ncbi:MAG: cobalt ABC transporter permease [Desulfuromonadales bacterium]|nr:cobalt ABC transporter permease [Desulfuromonadales bacterium]